MTLATDKDVVALLSRAQTGAWILTALCAGVYGLTRMLLLDLNAAIALSYTFLALSLTALLTLVENIFRLRALRRRTTYSDRVVTLSFVTELRKIFLKNLAYLAIAILIVELGALVLGAQRWPYASTRATLSTEARRSAKIKAPSAPGDLFLATFCDALTPRRPPCEGKTS